MTKQNIEGGKSTYSLGLVIVSILMATGLTQSIGEESKTNFGRPLRTTNISLTRRKLHSARLHHTPNRAKSQRGNHQNPRAAHRRGRHLQTDGEDLDDRSRIGVLDNEQDNPDKTQIAWDFEEEMNLLFESQESGFEEVPADPGVSQNIGEDSAARTTDNITAATTATSAENKPVVVSGATERLYEQESSNLGLNTSQTTLVPSQQSTLKPTPRPTVGTTEILAIIEKPQVTSSPTSIPTTAMAAENTVAVNTVSFAQEAATTGSNSLKGRKSKTGAFGVVAEKESKKESKEEEALSVAGYSKKSGSNKGKNNAALDGSRVSGKGSKGGYKSGSKYASSSGTTAGTSGSGTVVVSNGISAPSPTSVVSPAVGAPSTSAEELSNVDIDCEGIAAGTASTNAPKIQSFNIQANWLLENSAAFDTVADGVQNYLQSEVAPAIAGCGESRRKERVRGRRHRRRWLQFMWPLALITNVVFDTPTSDGNCVTDQAVATCYTTDGATDIYYYGADDGVAERLMAFLQAAGDYPVDGLLGVANLSVYDASGNVVGRVGDGTESTDTEPAEGANNDFDKTTEGNTEGNTDILDADGIGDGSVNEEQRPGDLNVAGATGQTFEETSSEDDGMSEWSKILIGVSVATASLGLFIFFILYCLHCRKNDQVDNVDFASLPSEKPVPQFIGKGAGAWSNDGGSIGSSDEFEDGEYTIIEVDAKGGTNVEEGKHEELPADAVRDYYVDDTVTL